MLGGIAFVLFAIIFFRLWYLQVLSGDEYLSQARDNRVRERARRRRRAATSSTATARTLVENRAATVVSSIRRRCPRPSATPPRRGASR